jgi:hypothetical protein
LLENPLTAPVHYLDRILYLEGMNSGYGIPEAVEFLNQEAQAKTITLLIHEKLGNPPQGTAVYLWKNPRVRLVPTLLPDHHRVSDAQGAVYFIYPYTNWPQERFLLENPDFKKVWSYSKPDKQYSVDIFKRREN